MTNFETAIEQINDQFLANDLDAATRSCAAIFTAPEPDYDMAITALALLRNHGLEDQWEKWAEALNERDFGVPTELTPVPYPFGKAPFDGSERRFDRLNVFIRGGQSGTIFAFNPIKQVVLDESGIALKRRFGGEVIRWQEIDSGTLRREQVDSMADLVGLPGIKLTLTLDRNDGGKPVKLDVSTCSREFAYPKQLLAAIETRVTVERTTD